MSETYAVKKINTPVDWTVTVPGSKSMTNRALLIAALAECKMELEGVLFSDDSRYFLSSLQSLGFLLEIDEKEKRVVLAGCGGRIPKKEAEIYVGSAGTAARFLTAMLGCSDGRYTIQASEQMKKRPMKPLFDLLAGMGAKIFYLEQEGFLPIQIEGINYSKSQDVESDDKERMPVSLELDISKSTQFLSAMLLVSPMLKQGMQIRITSEKTDGSYIRITRKMMETFGVTTAFDGRNYEIPAGAVYRLSDTHYVVEPDMSAACYFYAAAAMTGGKALVRNVHMDNTQGDLKFLGVLEKMGCTVEDMPEGIRVSGPAVGELRGIDINMNDFSDQTMTLAVMAPFAKEKVHISGIGHIRLQESDRIHGIVTELTRLGIRCEEEEAAITIYPGEPSPGLVQTYEDHRMAMAFSLIGLRAEGIVINDPFCCKKTFENYFEVLSDLTRDMM